MQTNYQPEFDDHRPGDTAKETTMHCDDVWDLLSVYADGEASPAEAASVELHVAVCADCARDLAFMKSTTVALSEVEEVEPPAALREAIFAATINRPSLQDRFLEAVRRTLTPAPARYGALAAAGAVAALTLVALHEHGGQLPNPVEYHPRSPQTVASAPPAAPRQPGSGPLDNLNILPVPATRPTSDASSHGAVRVAHTARGTRRAGARRSQPIDGGPAPSAYRTARAVPDFRTRVAAALVQPEVVTPDEADVMPAPTDEPLAVANAGVAATTVQPAASAAAAAQPARIQLVSSASPMDPGQAATLADLRRILRRQNGEVDARAIRESLRDREIRINVIKGSF